jgi:hypothetical protein
MNKCQVCGKKPKRSFYKYCSNKCQADERYNTYIENWKQGEISGGKGIVTKNISRYVKRYFIEKHSEKCQLCSWDKRNPITNKVPLEMDHVDGNSENNFESNLQLICPNCHSLSPNFRNLNKGKGRLWRKEKYVRITN